MNTTEWDKGVHKYVIRDQTHSTARRVRRHIDLLIQAGLLSIDSHGHEWGPKVVNQIVERHSEIRSNSIWFDLKSNRSKDPPKGFIVLLTEYIFTILNSVITGTSPPLDRHTLISLIWPREPLTLWRGIWPGWESPRNWRICPYLPRYNDAITDPGGLPQTTLISTGRGRGMCYLSGDARVGFLLCVK